MMSFYLKFHGWKVEATEFRVCRRYFVGMLFSGCINQIIMEVCNPMAKTRQPVMRVSSFDVPCDLYQLADSQRIRERITWKDFLSEAIRLRVASANMEVTNQPGGIEEV